MPQVLIVNLETGHFVDKQDREKQVTCYGDTNVRHIMPLMTQPFKFRNSGTLVPRWEELLIFNESFDYLSSAQQTSSGGGRDDRTRTRATTATQGREKLGLFFLVQDFVSMNRANNSNASEDKSGDGKGWHDVAWAFLKPFPSPGEANTETKLRLQLYKPSARKMPAADGGGTAGAAERPENEARVVWNWWMNCKHVKYPSSLYVTVQAILPPKESGGGRGDGEDGSGGKEQSRTEVKVQDRYQAEEPTDNGAVAKAMADAPKVPIWNRAPGTKCQIPNAEVARLEGAGRGVYCQKFSRCGRHLALGCPAAGGGASVIFVHDATVPSYPLLMQFGGHSGPIYELDWHDHRTLLSASGDGTAQVWHLGRGSREVLEHPTFVYCARFHPNSLHVIVTGSYDRVIRVWKWNREEERYSVQQVSLFVTSTKYHCPINTTSLDLPLLRRPHFRRLRCLQSMF